MSKKKKMDRPKRKLYYIVSTGDKWEFPLVYALHAKEVAEWLGCETGSVFRAFLRGKRAGKTVVSVMGYNIERVPLDSMEDE